MRVRVDDRYQFSRSDGPLGISARCLLCRFYDFVRKPPEGQRGRGWGMREGNKQRGRMIQHFNAVHKARAEEESA